MHRYKLAWDLFIGLLYLCSYFIDPYMLAFYHEPYEDRHVQVWNYLIACIFIIDSILTPFTGV